MHAFAIAKPATMNDSKRCRRAYNHTALRRSVSPIGELMGWPAVPYAGISSRAAVPDLASSHAPGGGGGRGERSYGRCGRGRPIELLMDW